MGCIWLGCGIVGEIGLGELLLYITLAKFVTKGLGTRACACHRTARSRNGTVNVNNGGNAPVFTSFSGGNTVSITGDNRAFR